MHSITHGGANCNILRRIFARMRERRGFFVPFCRLVRPAAACASPRAQRKPAVPREPPRRFLRRGGFGFFPRRRARMGAAAGSGELGRKGAAAGSGGMERMRGGGGGALESWGKRAAAGERERKERGMGERGEGRGEEGKRKKRSAILPNASYGGSFVSRRGRWNKRSICGSRKRNHKYRANISPPLRGRRGLLPKAYSSPCATRSGFQKSRSSGCRTKRTHTPRWK